MDEAHGVAWEDFLFLDVLKAVKQIHIAEFYRDVGSWKDSISERTSWMKAEAPIPLTTR